VQGGFGKTPVNALFARSGPKKQLLFDLLCLKQNKGENRIPAGKLAPLHASTHGRKWSALAAFLNPLFQSTRLITR
jgi:hypothetical protein